MRKIKKKLLKIVAALAIAAFAVAPAGFAGGMDVGAADTSAKLTLPQSVSKGESFKISVTFTSSASIGSVKARLDYDDNVIEFVSGEFASGGGGLCLINGWAETVGKTITFELTFKAVGDGTTQITLEQTYVYSDTGDLIGSPETSANITAGNPSTPAQTTGVTTKAPVQTSETTTTTTTTAQTVTEQTTVTTTTVETTTGPEESSGATSSEQVSQIVTEPEDGSAAEEISEVVTEEDESFSETDSSEEKEKEKSDSKGSITAILMIVGCIAIACIIMMGDGKGKKRSSRSGRK